MVAERAAQLGVAVLHAQQPAIADDERAVDAHRLGQRLAFDTALGPGIATAPVGVADVQAQVGRFRQAVLNQVHLELAEQVVEVFLVVVPVLAVLVDVRPALVRQLVGRVDLGPVDRAALVAAAVGAVDV
ncbi:hypothetical protein D3C84_917380 [compost metagenome]